MTTLSNSKPKARKEHQCNYCSGIIKKNEVYENQTNVYEGDMYTWKSHLKCSEITSHFNMHDEYSEGLTEDAFRDYITEAYKCYFIQNDLAYYESKEFKYPDFLEQLDFVIKNKEKIKL